jgi:tRNA(Ile)-lysidine synthase
MTFSPGSLLSSLNSLLPDDWQQRKLLIALSGGMDSVVLLHSLCALKTQGKLSNPLSAVHINHGLQTQADDWQQHCEELCDQLGVPIHSEAVEVVVSASGSGLENAARVARYQVFESRMDEQTVLLQAHHRDDQMETLLLRLMRGAGALGLSGIPACRALANGLLARPLLVFDRSWLQGWAEQQGLRWQEDESNADEQFDRNYCRRSLLPMIEKRWPAYRESWSKTVALESESAQMLQSLAEIDLQACLSDCGKGVKVTAAMELDEPRRRNMVRYWISAMGLADPGWNRLRQLSMEVLPAAQDSAGIELESYMLQRFRSVLFAVSNAVHTVQEEQASWDIGASSQIELTDNGSLEAISQNGKGLSLAKCEDLDIRYRQGSESCQLAGRPTKMLKKILHEERIELWLRSRMPLLYSGDTLVCIPGVGVAEGFQAQGDEQGWQINWQKPAMLYAPDL